MQRPGRLTRIVVALVAAAGLTACGPEETAEAPPPPGVLVAAAGYRVITTGREFVGRTTAIDDVELRARVSGYLLERTFEEGSNVAEGDLLFRIDPAIYAAEVEVARGQVAQFEAEVARAQRDVTRYRELAKTQNVSAQALDQAEATLLTAQANLKSARAQQLRAENDLRDTEIHAPFGGRIGAASVAVGDLVDPGAGALARLVDLDPIYVTFNVSERLVLDFIAEQRRRGIDSGPIGIPVGMKLPNGTEYPHPGRIDFVDNAVNQRTGTIVVRARFPNPDEFVVPGINVQVTTTREDAGAELVIPQASVQADQGGRFVLVVDGENVVEQRRVILGRQDAADWVVQEGLVEGERVIVEGVQKVRPGMTVAATEAVRAFEDEQG